MTGRNPNFDCGGFVAGTLVHTKEGLKPIEQIQFGDYVLSKHESGEGGLDYKRVTRTFVLREQKVWHLPLIADDRANPDDDPEKRDREQPFLVTTGSHPFWVRGYGDMGGTDEFEPFGQWGESSWVPLEELRPLYVLERADGGMVYADFRMPMFEIGEANQAWYPTSQDGDGAVVVFRESGPVRRADFYPGILEEDIVLFDDDDNQISHKRTVYNLEVEDFHTYFVHELGVLVHNREALPERF